MPDLVYYDQLTSSPFGPLWLAVSPFGLVAVEWDCPEMQFTQALQHRLVAVGRRGLLQRDAAGAAHACRELAEYLAGRRKAFTLPIDWDVLNEFQRKVLQATYEIPCGETRTYAQIARQIGRPNAARAVGRAEATNPMPLILPCHRVVGSDGRLHGYGGPGGIRMKEWLLNLERKAS